MFLKGLVAAFAFSGLLFVNCEEEKKLSATEQVVNSNNIFTENIYQALLKTKKFDNVVTSPFSLASVLAMLRAGATGETAKELSQGLQLEKISDPLVHEGYAALLSQLQDNRTDVVIETGNRVFTAEKFPLKDSYLQLLREKYLSAAEKTDFAKPEEAAEKINKFVETATHEKIKNIINSKSLSPDTVSILVNTIYFKGIWKTPFKPEKTAPKNFTALNGEFVTVDMMSLKDTFNYSQIERLNSTVVSLPYKGDRFSLVIILPDENKTISDVEPLLTNSILAKLPSELRETNVHVKFPKFKLESEIEFVDTKILENLGMKKLLTPTAEFSGITDVGGVYVSKVLQKAFIEINEEGTEAAAATIGNFQTVSIRTFLNFEVNRPFIAYIYDEITKAVIFVIRKVQ